MYPRVSTSVAYETSSVAIVVGFHYDNQLQRVEMRGVVQPIPAAAVDSSQARVGVVSW